MMGLSFQELLIFMMIIAVLSGTGLWQSVIRGIRELRGEPVEPNPPPSAPGRDVDLCYKLLGLTPSASWEEVERAYRQKAKLHHPDHGGDGDTMQALNDAYSRIKKSRGK